MRKEKKNGANAARQVNEKPTTTLRIGGLFQLAAHRQPRGGPLEPRGRGGASEQVSLITGAAAQQQRSSPAPLHWRGREGGANCTQLLKRIQQRPLLRLPPPRRGGAPTNRQVAVARRLRGTFRRRKYPAAAPAPRPASRGPGRGAARGRPGLTHSICSGAGLYTHAPRHGLHAAPLRRTAAVPHGAHSQEKERAKATPLQAPRRPDASAAATHPQCRAR